MMLWRKVGRTAEFCVERLIRFCHVAAIAAMLGILGTILSQAVGRYLGISIPGAIEITAMLLPVAISLELAPTLVAGGHIRVELLLSALSRGWRDRVEFACWLAGSILAGALAYASAKMAWQSYLFNSVDNQGELAIPLVYPHAAVAFGIVVLFLSTLRELAHMLISGRRSAPDADPIEQLSAGS